MFDFLQPDTANIIQILVTAPLLYALVVIGIRIVGARATSSMNNFDWIVTVAIGSIFASTVVLNKTNLVEGMFGIFLLLVLQFCVTAAVERWDPLRRVMKATPQLLVYEGEFLHDNMKRERVIEAEVFAAIRQRGYKSIDNIYAVVLETNAMLSVIPNGKDDAKGFSLGDVGGLPDGLKQDLKERGEDDDTETDTDDTATDKQQENKQQAAETAGA